VLHGQGVSYPEFDEDEIYKHRKYNINEHTHFLTLFNKSTDTFITKGYDPSILQRTVCLVVSPFIVLNHDFIFSSTSIEKP